MQDLKRADALGKLNKKLNKVAGYQLVLNIDVNCVISPFYMIVLPFLFLSDKHVILHMYLFHNLNNFRTVEMFFFYCNNTNIICAREENQYLMLNIFQLKH